MADTPKDLITGLLRRLKTQREALTEKQLAYVGELAEYLYGEAGEEEIFFSDPVFAARYAELTMKEEPSTAAKVNRMRVERTEGMLDVMMRAFLLCRLCDSLGIRGLSGVGTFFEEPSPEENETVAYVKSVYADEAYLRFSEGRNASKVFYTADPAEACRKVSEGACRYCLLPIEGGSEGQRRHVRGLLAEHGLKKTAQLTVTTAPKELTTFAVFQKELSAPKKVGNTVCLDFRMISKTGTAPLVAAADACGMQVLALVPLHTVPSQYEVTVKICEEGLAGFLSYLYLEHPTFFPTGLYGIL